MIVNDNNGRTVFRTERDRFLLCYFFFCRLTAFFLFIFCSKHSRTRKKNENKIKDRIIVRSFRRTNISIETNRKKTVRRLLEIKKNYVHATPEAPLIKNNNNNTLKIIIKKKPRTT